MDSLTAFLPLVVAIVFLMASQAVSQDPAKRSEEINAGWPPSVPGPKTRAEASDFKATSRQADVLAFIEALKAEKVPFGLSSMGKSSKGQEIPVLVISKAGAFEPAAAQALGLPIVMVLANIHAGEVEGKEAVQMLARDLLHGTIAPFHEAMTLVLIPNFNADGNDRVDPKNRSLHLKELWGQLGPDEGVGERQTAEGVDLNRDYLLLRAPESRHLNALYRAWMPHVFVDCHTTNGSIHAYELTYSTAHNPASGPAAPILYARDTMLPAIAKKLRDRTGFRTFFYGNFRDNADPLKGWETYPALPRYGSHFRGLTGVVEILLESYSYADFRTRTHVTYEFLREIFTWVRDHAAEVKTTVEAARADVVARGAHPDPADRIGIDYTTLTRRDDGKVDFGFPVYPLYDFECESYDLESLRRHEAPGKSYQTYKTTFFGRYVPTRTVARPRAYLVPKERTKVIEHLALHGLRTEVLAAERVIPVAERYVIVAKEPLHSQIGGFSRDESVFTLRSERVKFTAKAGDVLVPMDQPLAHVAIYLLEPESDDGLVRWGFFADLGVGDVYPVHRLLDVANEGGAQ